MKIKRQNHRSLSLLVDSDEVRRHFDDLADAYDQGKQRNWYYYDQLKRIVKAVIPAGRAVLDVGTGTGEILNSLCPSRGTGIDLSRRMIDIARKKFPHLTFVCAGLESFEASEGYDAILLADVIEHFEDPSGIFCRIRRLCATHTRVVVVMANPWWEPLLVVLEELGLKMPEGPHQRVSRRSVEARARSEHFRRVSFDTFVLLPVYVPVLSRLVNDYVARLPIVKHLALIQRLVFKPESSAACGFVDRS